MPEFNSRRKKKVYTFGHSQPQQVVRSGTEYFDRARTERANPFYGLFGSLATFTTSSGEIVITAEYDDGIALLDNTETGTVTFATTFTVAPVVVISFADLGNNIENIVGTISNITTTGFSYSLSAPFTGFLSYKAIYATAYPAILPSPYVGTGSAGYVDITNDDTFVATYSSLGSVPTEFYITVEDRNVSGDALVAVVDTGSYGLTTTPVSLSAPVTDRAHYIALKT